MPSTERPSLPRRILLADADAFFVAVARQVDPQGAGRASLLIVGGAPGSRGVVCSASYEARQHGVRSAMPISRALRLCPKAMCVPVPRRACSQKSGEIAAVLRRFAPVVECASVDEWYLDLTGTEGVYPGRTLDDVALATRAAVLEETGLTVSFGGGSSRLVAKLAVELAKSKPDRPTSGTFVVPAGEEATFMLRFDLADLPGVGPKFRERLDRHGLRTVRDVVSLDAATLTRLVGAREAEWLSERTRGMDSTSVSERDVPKRMSREETFDHDIATDDDLHRELLRLVTRAASDLREQDLAARTITVKLRDTDFRTRQASRTLPEPVVADRVIFETARELLARLRGARRVRARLIGVALSSLGVPDRAAQLSLFETPSASLETARDRALAGAVDKLRAKFGAAAIVPGRLTRRP
ncbi:MAG TPA: DNA polymerase IV [Gaiellaceae bacterium]|nr:DNA polymerase IV [Gaiellaceae bacterium]